MPIHRDAIETQLVAGNWEPPAAGKTVTSIQGPRRTWRRAEADDDGRLRDDELTGGYAITEFSSPTKRTMLLEARGHAAVYVNGELRAGDPYRTGNWTLPVEIQQGDNHLLFHLAGTELEARLVATAADLLFQPGDVTLPDLVADMSDEAWGSVALINVAPRPRADLSLRCDRGDGYVVTTALPTLAPHSITKVPFRLFVGPSPERRPPDSYTLQVVSRNSEHDAAGTAEAAALAETTIRLRRPADDEPLVCTFRSAVDGSIQAYAVRLASSDAEETKALIMSLHGAAVKPRQQVSYFAAKPWAHVLAPMGRRDHGFDWEDWSRSDALEALNDVQSRIDIDPQRVFLTGHSMGGHGVWHLGATYPDRFAAIGPSGGWFSFWTYGGGMPKFRKPNDIQKILLRAPSPSDTLQLKQNLSEMGVYVLHGSNDQQVPVRQSRAVRRELATFHSNFSYYEKPQAPHWWGADTCDWPAMSDFFQRHKKQSPREKHSIDFTTLSPGVSAWNAWVGVEAQIRQNLASRVVVQRDIQQGRIAGKTQNVARLSFDVTDFPSSKPVQVLLDGQVLPPVTPLGGKARLWFERHFGRWLSASQPPPEFKGPHRYGSLKQVFGNRPLLVYGTRGTPEENRWALAKARFDAESFLYRGNGLLEVVSDVEFRSRDEPQRNVVLYGNADTNGAWPALLSTCPIQIRRGQLLFGVRPELGDDVACIFVRPRPGDDQAMVAVISGTGLDGFRTTNRLRYFVSGIAYPDVIILGSAALATGTDEIRALGYFGLDWKLETGEVVWRDVAL